MRTENDRGALLLIDSRFAQPHCIRLLPDEWCPIPRTSMGVDIEACVRQFWEKS
ncbi:MAG TPA: hypothetical protein PLD49_09455 [Thermoclostridium caenicola]|nr:hypothetical protein [Thermoclostridium caenicola]